MSVDQIRLQYLFEKFFNKTATNEERNELSDLIQDSQNKEYLLQLFESTWEKFKGDSSAEVLTNNEADTMLERILGTGKSEPKIVKLNTQPKRQWWRYLAAASIVLLLGAGALLWFSINQPRNQKTVAHQQIKTDVAPGHEGAILTLADGRQIVLDSTKNGVIAQQGNGDVIKQQNALSYQTGKNDQQSVVYNTMKTPNGRQYTLVLADGSKVWLNSGSSITFPTAFIGKERKVQVTGEAYFEVAKNPAMPFRVLVNDMTVEVLGTHFDINSYSDEDAIKTTLLEGAVKVTKGDKVVRLTPGQQSVLENNGALSVNKDVNTDEVVAWKEGYFRFQSADLPTILRQFARWYDVQVIYQGQVPTDKFFVIVKRSSTLSSVLKALQATDIHFKIEGQKLIVQAS